MIVGNGDIASIITDRNGALFFASGVSNSGCADQQQFKRERDLLKSLVASNENNCCFYFSSIFVDTKDTPYFRHKFLMETLVKDAFKNCNIIRLGNITWGDNPHTFINFIRYEQANGRAVKIKDEYRYVIDRAHLEMLTQSLPLVGQYCISAFTRRAKVKDFI